MSVVCNYLIFDSYSYNPGTDGWDRFSILKERDRPDECCYGKIDLLNTQPILK